MRLSVLHDGFGPVQKALMWLMFRGGRDVPGPVAVMSYRRELHGKHFTRAFQQAMRGARHWGKGDVELFAAFVSKQNQCVY